MKVLLLGSGGREHALARAIAKSELLEKLWIAPGNPGTATVGENVPGVVDNPAQVLELAQSLRPDLVVIGPEAPLVKGVADVLRQEGFKVFGPGRLAARLEGSKAFAKTIMQQARVATAASVACRTLEEARGALQRFGSPYVVKQDGLAAGKGVVVTSDFYVALTHAAACIEAVANPHEPAVVIEEFLEGPEASVFCICDGRDAVALPIAQDYKRAYDHNEGPNTGGMGAYSPLPWAPQDLAQRVAQEIALPVCRVMADQGCEFIGLLYVGLALTSRGPRVVEFNVRFGDPETQSVLERLDTDLLALLAAAADGNLAAAEQLQVSDEAVVNVVLAASGYPQTPVKGGVITGLETASQVPGVHIIHAGTKVSDSGQLIANGGRVLSVVARGNDLSEARQRAYQAMDSITLEGSHFRTDIAEF
ncbi:phosphoribosylamine--glycine ligase [Mobiluncus curtisii]|uniref:Phosphoribosylamine--glycine ligase n=1 Tax=Mobiluncus curtisii ATCC 51333 TaxID=887326 RepID=E6LX93_9ACTO|nr:phosphoribosylamine--glycine ligase [Mobiluncus curtisii]EFU80647.1 phosphoribosylamine--glycine ligase [Mobiluncus curtisii ATCC 51333]